MFSLNTNAQKVFESEIIYGGITGGGFSTNTGSGTVISNVSIPPNSNIKKAYLLATRDGVAPNIDVVLNGITYQFSNQSVISNSFTSYTYNTTLWTNSTIHAIDITDNLDSSVTLYSLTIPPQFNITINGFYSSFYIYIVYENSDLFKITYNLFINEKNVAPISTYDLNNFPPINNNVPVCLGVWSTFFCDTIEDGTYIEVNGNELGLLGGTESNTLNSCTGVYSNFAHYNDSIFGLEDDIPDSLMKGTDALANIADVTNNNDVELEVKFTYQSNWGPFSNPIAALMLSYSTPCDTFSVAIPDKFLACKGDSTQLTVSGGVAYEWEATNGSALSALSCTNCPNPYFTDTVSRWYSVRVWNNDSCSKVLPVRVEVVSPLEDLDLQIIPTSCLANTGGIIIPVIDSSYQYSLDNGPIQNSPIFSNLPKGTYNLDILNAGCTNTFTIDIEEAAPIIQQLTISPTTCGDTIGHVNIQASGSLYVNYLLNDTLSQPNPHIYFIPEGQHIISVTDTNGCRTDSTIYIPAINNVTANFFTSPQAGDLPLEVNFTNQSTGATDFIWYIQGVGVNDTLYSTNPNYTFEEEGNFNVTLVAYDTYLHCSDTASVQIFATFPFTVIAPSLFVKQDAPYQIYTSNVATLQYELYNSIGQQLYNHTLHPTQGLNDVWYPYNISRGIYLYRITAQDDEGNEKVFSGKIVVI